MNHYPTEEGIAAIHSLPPRIEGHNCSTTYNWELLGGDDEESFQAKFRSALNDGIDNRYLQELKVYKKHPIQYYLNNYGFRSDDFNEKDEYNVFIGCSHTMGSGHYLENTWPYRMNKWLNDGTKIANISWGGEGIASGYRNLLKIKDKIKIKRVFCFYPHWMRYEFFSGASNNSTIISPYFNGFIETEFGKRGTKALNNYLMHYNTAYHYILSHSLSILAIAQELNVPLYYSSYFDMDYRSDPGDTDFYYARDQHSSTWVYNGIFKMFKEKVKNEESANLDYIIENTSTRSPDGDLTLMDNNKEGKILFPTPRFNSPMPDPIPPNKII